MEGVQALPSPGGTAEPVQTDAVASLRREHAVRWENGSVLSALHRERSATPRRNTSFAQLLLLSSGTAWCTGARKRHWAGHGPGSVHHYMLRSLQQ